MMIFGGDFLANTDAIDLGAGVAANLDDAVMGLDTLAFKRQAETLKQASQ